MLVQQIDASRFSRRSRQPSRKAKHRVHTLLLSSGVDANKVLPHIRRVQEEVEEANEFCDALILLEQITSSSFMPPPLVSMASGRYSAPFEVTLCTALPSTEIFCSVDGSVLSAKSSLLQTNHD